MAFELLLQCQRANHLRTLGGESHEARSKKIWEFVMTWGPDFNIHQGKWWRETFIKRKGDTSFACFVFKFKISEERWERGVSTKRLD